MAQINRIQRWISLHSMGLQGLVLVLGLGFGLILYCRIWCLPAAPYMCPLPGNQDVPTYTAMRKSARCYRKLCNTLHLVVLLMYRWFVHYDVLCNSNMPYARVHIQLWWTLQSVYVCTCIASWLQVSPATSCTLSPGYVQKWIRSVILTNKWRLRLVCFSWGLPTCGPALVSTDYAIFTHCNH